MTLILNSVKLTTRYLEIFLGTIKILEVKSQIIGTSVRATIPLDPQCPKCNYLVGVYPQSEAKAKFSLMKIQPDLGWLTIRNNDTLKIKMQQFEEISVMVLLD